jgi:hypothetical protein
MSKDSFVCKVLLDFIKDHERSLQHELDVVSDSRRVGDLSAETVSRYMGIMRDLEIMMSSAANEFDLDSEEESTEFLRAILFRAFIIGATTMANDADSDFVKDLRACNGGYIKHYS